MNKSPHPDHLDDKPVDGGRSTTQRAIDAAIDAASRLLRLPTMRDRYPEIADAAARE